MHRWEFFYTLAEKFNDMIKPLPKYDDELVYNISEPLLDYVRDFSNNYWKNRSFLSFEKDNKDLYTNVSPFPSTFAKRLSENKIKNYKLNEYQNAVAEFKPKRHISIKELDNDQHYNLQQQSSDEGTNISLTLRAFNLDASKFWYLCLMLKDYIVGTVNENAIEEVNTTHRMLITSLVLLLENLESQEVDGLFFSSGNIEMELWLQLKNKGDKKFDSFKINDSHTLTLIKLALKSFLEAHKEECDTLDFPAVEKIINTLQSDEKKGKNIDKKRKSQNGQMALFYRYLKWFLDKQEIDMDYVNNNTYTVSISKDMLISRMAYYTGLTDDTKYLTQDGTFLRRHIRRYEDIEESHSNQCYEFPKNIQDIINSAKKKGQ